MDTQVIRCGNCNGSIRVPRNMGRLKVTCPLCKYEFLFNSGSAIIYNNPSYHAPGPAAPGPAAPGPVKKPSKKGGGGRGVLAFLAVLLIIFLAASALGNVEKPSAFALPTISLEKPSMTIPPVGTAEIPSATALPTDSQSPGADVSLVPQGTAYDRASELIPYFELRYFLSRLTDTELDVICTLYENAMNYEESCTFEKRVDTERFNQLLLLLQVECPELFQLNFEAGFTYQYYPATQEVTECQLAYQIADQSKYEEMRRSCENVISRFVQETSNLSDYEKEKYVFDYIASNCLYNADAVYAGMPYGALVSHEAKCDGFSGAMKWSMEALGIQCLTVTGDPVDGGVGHAWNIIYMDGLYRMLDVTANVRNDWMVDAGISQIFYSGFNVSDAMNARYELRGFYSAFTPIPVCHSMDASYYARTGHFVPAGADPTEALSRELENLAASGGGFACIQFESAEDYAAFCDGTGDQALRTWLDDYGRSWSYTRWYMDYNVYLVKVTW